MVSLVLLTTEEVLKRNMFWHCLDSIWIAHELEPFEELQIEHVFDKPLSRDIYYAKHPDIPRSESEDEYPLTVNGFRNKHSEWKSKIYIRRLHLRNSISSRASIKSNIKQDPDETKGKVFYKEDDKVQSFISRLVESIPPPPLEDIDDSILSKKIDDTETLPDYSDLDHETNTDDDDFSETSSTTLNSDSESISQSDSWNETIYGLSDLISMEWHDNGSQDTIDRISWPDVIKMSGFNESAELKEDVISNSNGLKRIDDIPDDDDAYADFAIGKLKQSLKTRGMADSSSLQNLYEIQIINCHMRAALFESFYRLAPAEI